MFATTVFISIDSTCKEPSSPREARAVVLARRPLRRRASTKMFRIILIAATRAASFSLCRAIPTNNESSSSTP